jgi:hypothetical protein
MVNAVRDHDEVVKLLGMMRVIREVPSMDFAGVVEILAEFDEFDEVPEGQKIPAYQFTFTLSESGEVTRRTERV